MTKLIQTTVRQLDKSNFVVALVGIAGRLAQSIGLHRDGTVFHLPIFETELRRRLWWLIFFMDTRLVEEQGTPHTISQFAFDTKLPLNVDDEDIFPGMTEMPKERVGWTEMGHTLMRAEVVMTLRRINRRSPEFGISQSTKAAFTTAEQERMIEECSTRTEHYLQHASMDKPPQRLSICNVRLMIARMWVRVYHPLSRTEHGENLSQERRNKLYLSSIEVIEYSRLLGEDPSMTQRSRLLRIYFDWQAVRFILIELCTRTKGSLAERGWKAIDAVSQDWDELFADPKRGAVWQPLQKLLLEARQARQISIAGEAMDNEMTLLRDSAVNPSKAPPPGLTSHPEIYPWQNFTPGPMNIIDTDLPDPFGFDRFQQYTVAEYPFAPPRQQFDGWMTGGLHATGIMTTQPTSFDGSGWVAQSPQHGSDQYGAQNILSTSAGPFMYGAEMRSTDTRPPPRPERR